jgi:predicted SnoaL-like aldol condensation-catalyzing enzyme
MNTATNVLAVLAMTVAALPGFGADRPLTGIEVNKQLVIRFYNALMQGDVATLKALGRPDYRQHNPAYGDTLQGLVDRIAERAPRPAGAPPIPPLQFVRVIAEGDYVMLLRRMPIAPNPEPTPQAERANVDIFRVQEGKVAEHWDYAENFPRGTDAPARCAVRAAGGSGRLSNSLWCWVSAIRVLSEISRTAERPGARGCIRSLARESASGAAHRWICCSSHETTIAQASSYASEVERPRWAWARVRSALALASMSAPRRRPQRSGWVAP